VPEFKPPRSLPPALIEAQRKQFLARVAAAEKAPVNEARIGTLEIGGPYNQPSRPSEDTLKKIYTCRHFNRHHDGGCARKIVGDFARRAFRRPVTPAEVDRLAALVTMAQREGDSFEEGLCQSLQAILVSPYFLFRIERDASAGSDKTVAINQYELASRLSYFLWSSTPDEELMKLADRQALRDPAVLAAQVRRMLADPKSDALVENFAGQWLELRKLESAKPDRKRFPEFHQYLPASIPPEPQFFFQNIVRENRSILEFIDGDYSFLNERLAEFYGIPGVKGPEFRRVALTGETHRGGLLTQASVLTVSSYATRTSPVLRGKWILEK